MPILKVQHVVSCSSEDKIHKSENLLIKDHYRKWKSAEVGEKQVSVILQLEKSSVIHSLDIGNEGSAFVEVLVGRSSDPKQVFNVLLVTSAFMSPAECRQGNAGINRVRMFGPEKLSQTISKDKWDLVKIVCTQPFNKTVKYGLSFVVFNSPPDKNDTAVSPDTEKRLGAFKIKTPDESDSQVSVGSWFAKRKNSSQEMDPLTSQTNVRSTTPKPKELDPVTGPANIRSAGPKHENSDRDTTPIMPKKIKLERKDNSPDRENTNLTTTPSAAVTVKKEKNQEPSNRKSMPDRKSTSTSQSQISSHLPARNNNTPVKSKAEIKNNKSQSGSSTTKSAGSSKSSRVKTSNIPFNKIMGNVVFVLSGYQNPQRGNIRDKALEMGAKYKADWDHSCTHLICAFQNTPKFQQVHKKGARIATEKWILECHKQKRFLPWRQFMLGKSSHPETSESEDSDSSEQPVVQSIKKSPIASTSRSNNTPNRIVPGSSKKLFPSPGPSKIEVDQMDSDEIYEAPTDVDSDSSCDTETEIAKVVAKKKSNKGVKTDDPLNASFPPLPNMFKNVSFFLFGDFDKKEKKSLVRFIIGCCGVIEDYMNKSVTYVLTNSKWKQEFTDAVSKNKSLRILKPDWIFECIEHGKIIPHSDFLTPRR